MIDLDAQFLINMTGHLGLSGRIATWDAATLAAARQRIAQYKRIRPVLRGADVFHLTPQRLGAMQAALYVDAASGRGLLFAFHGGDAALKHTIRLRGLDASRRYSLSMPVRGMPWQPPGAAGAASVTGKALVEQGLTLTFPHSGAAALLEIEPAK
jgi:alpha-galactosidase